ncbi:MAG: hypothetical protein K6E13_11475, partial [Lachnospiraceae bacterium]|nr:hypothetical protein [Lachnospiraceae bacterium]
MLYTNIRAERIRQSVSDFSEDWSFDEKNVDIDSLVTSGESISFSKTLPDDLQFNDSLCFASVNVHFKVFIGDECVYSYTAPKNFTGYGYGIAYHSINLSTDMVGESVRFEITSVFKSGNNGKIRLLSIENSKDYSARLVSGQILPFIISSSISLMGFLLLFLKYGLHTKTDGFNIFALAITAIITGIWMTFDTGFFRLVTNNVVLT